MLAIGRYPEASLANAEKKATSSLELLAEGIKAIERVKMLPISKPLKSKF